MIRLTFVIHVIYRHQNLNRENLGLNPLVTISKLGQFFSLHVASVHSAVNKYLSIDSGGYVNK